MKCKICGHPTKKALTHAIRTAHIADYLLCPNCDFMFVSNPTWLTEAYARPINITDTGYVMRNIYLSRKTLILFSLLFKGQGTFIDYAGGYGILTRIMRDYGLNFLWDDLYTENLFAQGFEYKKEKSVEIKALTCFECFEHFIEPVAEIKKMLSISDTILFSTLLKPLGICPPENWQYYGFNHGQHTSFYSKKTFCYIAEKYGIYYYGAGENLHILSKRKLNKRILSVVNILTKLQADVFIKKILRTKTTSDQQSLIKKGF